MKLIIIVLMIVAATLIPVLHNKYSTITNSVKKMQKPARPARDKRHHDDFFSGISMRFLLM